MSFGNAAVPGNDSERLFFRNLFDNLVRLDCEGTVRRGLAETWTADSAGQWILTLRKGAVARNLRPVRATDSAGAGAPRIDFVFGPDDRRVLVVTRDYVADSLPRFLADPALALADGLPPASEPTPRRLVTPRRANLPVIDFRFDRGLDPRDALDEGVDLMVSRDPELVDYVSNRPEFATFALPWSRAYVLLETGNPGAGLADALDAASFQQSLARDAVRAEARVAQPPYWWNDRGGCATSIQEPHGASSRVVYRKDDEVARGIAERIVAVASAGLQAIGLEAADFARAVRNGDDRAYVIGLPRQSLAPCRDASGWPAGARLLPLIDTRAYAIIRKGVPSLAVEWDGTVRIVNP